MSYFFRVLPVGTFFPVLVKLKSTKVPLFTPALVFVRLKSDSERLSVEFTFAFDLEFDLAKVYVSALSKSPFELFVFRIVVSGIT